MSQSKTLDEILTTRLSENDPRDRDVILIKSAAELTDYGHTQDEMNELIDRKLAAGELFLTSQELISRKDDCLSLNIFLLKKALVRINKSDLFPHFLHAIRFSLEVNYLAHTVISAEVSRIVDRGLHYIRENCPDIRVLTYDPSQHFGLTLGLKSLMFVSRSFVDKLLLILNRLNFILRDPAAPKGRQPSTDISRFYEQFERGELGHLDPCILRFLNEQLRGILFSRFIRNNLKLGSDISYQFTYSDGDACVMGILVPTQRDDWLLDALVKRGVIQGLNTVSLRLPDHVWCHDRMMTAFLSAVYGVLTSRISG